MARYIHPKTNQPVVSVTELLPKIDFFVSPDRLAELAEEGKKAHDDFHNGIGIYAEINTEIEKEYGKTIISEVSLYSTSCLYAGTPDRVCEKAIVDKKRTFVNSKYHALQLAGYNLLCIENGIGDFDKWIIVTNDEHGNAIYKNVYHPEAMAVFKMCLNRYLAEKRIENYLRTV